MLTTLFPLQEPITQDYVQSDEAGVFLLTFSLMDRITDS